MTWFKLCDFHKSICIFRIFKHSRHFICKAKSTIFTAKQVAHVIHRSESYTMKLFHDELGITISHFVNRCKLEEAKSLLSHTEMTLSEISNYLCFSSQSYFQNLFKKKYGVTPNAYRKKFLHILP